MDRKKDGLMDGRKTGRLYAKAGAIKSDKIDTTTLKWTRPIYYNGRVYQYTMG